MNVVEYVGKDLLRAASVNVPAGGAASNAAEAKAIAARLGGRVVIKAQIAAGKRGKGGGIRFADDADGAEEAANALIGSTINGFPVAAVLVEAAVPIAREFYAAVMNDPAAREARLLFSTSGGMEIEDVASGEIRQATLDIRRPLDLSTARAIAAETDAGDANLEAIAQMLVTLYDVYRANDAELVEINPLVLTKAGELVALDCKLVLDDSARERHEELFARAAAALGEQGTDLERNARAQGLLYMELDGDVGILANGAGLTMTTMDVIAHFGGARGQLHGDRRRRVHESDARARNRPGQPQGAQPAGQFLWSLRPDRRDGAGRRRRGRGAEAHHPHGLQHSRDG